MKGLTAKQAAVWDMVRLPADGGLGLGGKEVARRLGVSVRYVWRTTAVCRKKLGLKAETDRYEKPLAENAKPEKVAQLITTLSDPNYDSLRAAYKALGHPPLGEAVIKRLRVKFNDVISAERELRRQELSEMLGKKIHLSLGYIDDKVLAEASFRDIALGTSALIEKKQLVDGQPTQIVSDLERKRLNELLPLLSAEMQRRGITIDGQVVEKTINAEPSVPAA